MPRRKNWILKSIFHVIEWSMVNNNYCDDFEVYKDCGYVVVSTTGRNHTKMGSFSFTTLMSNHREQKAIHALIPVDLC